MVAHEIRKHGNRRAVFHGDGNRIIGYDDIEEMGRRFCQRSRQQVQLTGTSSPLRGRQDADHREGAGEDMQAAVAGGNMLVTI